MSVIPCQTKVNYYILTLLQSDMISIIIPLIEELSEKIAFLKAIKLEQLRCHKAIKLEQLRGHKAIKLELIRGHKAIKLEKLRSHKAIKLEQLRGHKTIKLEDLCGHKAIKQIRGYKAIPVISHKFYLLLLYSLQLDFE